VCDQETSNEEAKARFGAVENTTKRVVTPRKQTTNNVIEVPFRRKFASDAGRYSFGSCTFRECCEGLFLKTRAIYANEEKYLP
jgi:hypothetical protein